MKGRASRIGDDVRGRGGGSETRNALQALVEYALAWMGDQLFVSKYQLELSKKEEIQRFLEAQMAGEMWVRGGG